jgi:hypothetical protein
MQAITEGTHCPIQPSDIDTSQHFFDAFDHRETEISARWIVEFCQMRGSWQPFTVDELKAFYTPNDGFTFNRLLPLGYVTVTDGVCTLTIEFVAACYKSRPRKR